MSVTNATLAQRRSELAARRAALSAVKQRELEALLKQVTAAAAPASVITVRPTDEPAPLSFAQERLWFLDQLEPESVAYNVVVAFRIEGCLNLPALEWSINEIVRRQESLRTVFVPVNERPVQVVKPHRHLEVPVVDLAQLPAHERENLVKQLMHEGGHRRFDLANGPLLRTLVFRLSNEEHVLLVLLHHIIFDEWSMRILMNEAVQVYKALDRGEPSPLPELPIQYADFAHWQRQWLQGPVLEAELDYWRKQLDGSPPVLNLPTDRPRSAAITSRGDTLHFEVSEELTARLQRLTEAAGNTLFITLLSAFQILLSRYSGQDDIPVGTPVAGRRWVETEGVIGFFINTIVLRTKLSGDPSVREVLQRVREVSLEAQRHEDLPFERLVDELQPERSLSHSPLFQVMFGFQNARKQVATLPGLKVVPIDVETVTAKYELTLSMAEAGGKLFGSMEYNTDLFDASTIEQMLEHYRAILDSMTADPEQPISNLKMLSAAEQQRLLYDWNDVFRAYPQERRVHQIFEQRVEQTPNAIAVADKHNALTYAELNRRANQLAHHLRVMGAGPDKRIGICIERSPDALAVLLAALKSGAGYVPMSPSDPRERLRFILNDSEACLLVTQNHLRDRFGELSIPIVDLDTESETIASRPQINPDVDVAPSNLAYMIYTSGSTGTPKGVMIEHGAFASYMYMVSELYGLSASDRVLQFSTLNYDAHIEDIYPCLTRGGTVVLRDDEMLNSAQEFLAACGDLGVTLLVLPTAYWHVLTNGTTKSDWDQAPAMRLVTFGGEAILPDRVKSFLDSTLGRVVLMNTYGPTEATVIATAEELTQAGDYSRALIGGPLLNSKVYVLDENLRLVPAGVEGELFIGGEGLARGYLQRPDLTAERFVPHPFPSLDGERLYRTGDRVRYLPDGNIEYIGRVDHQVKIRGFRIETGEVEAALARHEGVSEAVVMVREEKPGERQLVAYVVSHSNGNGWKAPTIAELRSHLKERVPDYMLPSFFVLLDALPLTRSGKIDRRALPAPSTNGDRGTDYVAPRTPVEEMLVGIWESVLGRDHLGIEDNFFDAGGHSLLAAQLVSRIRKTFAVELPLRALFEHPNVAALSETIEELLRSGSQVSAPSIVPVSRDRELPLSFAQQRLWFLEQLEPGSVQYNIAEAVRLSGQLDHQALERSLNEVVRRHESLRTRFVATGGEARQVIEAARSMRLAVEEVAAEELPRLLREEAEQPFDLTSGELLRVRLFRLGVEEHVLAATMHHIISDEWSMNVLLRELSELYEVYRRGEEAQLPELPVQYADYAVWQREWLQGEVLEEQLRYWREQLAGAPEVLALPTDRQRPAVASHVGAYEEVRIAAETVQGLKRLSREQGATLFMTLLACFQAVLSRWSGETDVVVGTVVAGRERAETEGLVGFFVNTLALRTDLSGEPALAELVARVREVCVGAYAHQEVPFEKLVEELNVTRELSRTPLFQVALVLQNPETESLGLAGLGLQELEVSGEEHRTAKFDLQLSLRERGEEVVGTLEYNVQLYERATVARLARYVERMLAACAADATQRMTAVLLLTEAEREQLLWEWNEPVRKYESDGSVAEEFARQVEARAAAVAVQYEDAALSYGELERRSNQLAHYLRSRGVGAEVRVGLLLERSLELVVSVLGVLKAGGAYVPLEPGLPSERLRYMLEDAECGLLLTTAELRAQVAGWSGPVITVDGDAEVIAQASAAALPGVVSGANAAYVIYTSGSTGQPKGVVVTHGNILRLLRATQEWFGFGAADVWTMFHSYAFDFSVWELWGALLYGGRLVVVPYWVSRTPEAFAALLEREQVTVLNQTPSAFRQLAASSTETSRNVRVIVFGGEALEVGSLRGWYEQQGDGGPQLVNMYGITETTVHVTYRVLSAAEVARRRGSVIGWRIPDLQLYILDEHGEPAPVGVGGELYVGGAGLARGYLDRPELTATRFLPHPYSREAGARLYRTGDRGRYLMDGDVEYLGRVDQQVKIRGYRIETGEIEAVLSSHEAVREAVVVARAEGGEQRLVAYVVPRGEVDVNELRSYLRERLPDYMAPAHIVQLQQLPLTRNGKLDRGRLPAPQGQEGISAAYEAPRTTTEELIAESWEEFLGVARVGREDNFFDLGGHSLLATRVISRVREVFGIELPLRTLFEQPTVESLSEAIDEAQRAGARSAAPPIVPVDRNEMLPLSFAQERLWFLDQLEPGNAFYNVPSSVKLTGDLNIEVLQRALTEIVRRHEVLRTTFATVDGVPRQIIGPPCEVSMPLVDLSDLSEEGCEAAAREEASFEARQSFDLSTGPLLRARLLRLAEQEHIVLLTMHHIVSDGWSMGVLIDELSRLYVAYVSGSESPLPELSIQYADFAHWQQQWLRGEVLEQQLAYWREQLAAAPPVLELPVDRPRPAVQSYRGATHTLAMSDELRERLKRLSRAEGVTLFMTLLAAFQTLLWRYTGQRGITVGTPIANRNRRETEPLIGFFVNTLVLHTAVQGDESFRELLGRVREMTLGAYAHQDVPFEKLVEELQPERNLSTTPLFQVMFVLQNADGGQGALELPGLQLQSLETENQTAKFELLLAMSEGERGLRASFEYNTDLFDESTIVRMGRHFERLLESIVVDPEQSVADLELLSAAEREQLLSEWNDTASAYPAEQTIQALFEAQVERTPEQIAVRCGASSLSYAELNARANQLAHYLRGQGVGAEVRVGVLLERSVEMVVALLGILKAGGAYVPLDPQYPQARLSLMLQDAQVQLLLSDDRLRNLVTLPSQTQLISLTAEQERIASYPNSNPQESLSSSDNLAYVIYTSGSTGTPKGVAVPHRAVVRLIKENDYIDFSDTDVYLQLAPLSFDASTLELWGSLLNGARLVVMPPESPSLDQLGCVLRDEGVTTLWLTAGLFHLMVDERLEDLLAVRQLLAGGDVLSPARVNRFLAAASDSVLINGYGPTENTTFSSTYRMNAGQQFETGSVPIGKPIRNSTALVLDQNLHLCPIGVEGELYVGGDGLARGYLNRADLTAERFVPHPYSDEAGARLYRTGDVVCWNRHGELEYRGRVDQQVKIRGYRIEMGEVETALNGHESVREAVVLAHGEDAAAKRLVAYVVPQDHSLDVAQLSGYLREKLPSYMVPSFFVAIDSMPLSDNGKVDRAALPLPETEFQFSRYVAPRTQTEETLAAIWETVLQVERLGTTDDFFEVGGHSLTAIQLITRIRQAFAIELPLRTLYDQRTIAGLAESIDTILWAMRAAKDSVDPFSEDYEEGEL